MNATGLASGRQRAVAATAIVGLALLVATPAAAQERAYELVSPPGVDPDVRFGSGTSTPDGEYVCYHSERPFLGAESVGLVTADIGYCARRTSTGWVSEWVTGPRAGGRLQAGAGSQVYYVSPDGARLVFASSNGIFGEWEPPFDSVSTAPVSAYMFEDGVTRWLAPAARPPTPEGQINEGGTGERGPLAASEDLRYGMFNSRSRLVPEDTNDAYDVYAWTPEGVRLVSHDADGNAVGGLPPLPDIATPKQAQPGAVSRDGRRMFFLHRGPLTPDAPSGVFNVFMREDGRMTHVSPRRGPGPAQDVRFAAATPDGRTVYLTTAEQLTDEAKEPGDALYQYDIDADELSLSATHPDGILHLATSDDGSTVVYATRSRTAPLLIIRRNGVETVLGTANPARTAVGDGDNPQSLWGGVLARRWDKRALRVSPDGRVVVFASSGDYGLAAAGTVRVYRWEAGRGLTAVAIDAEGRLARRDARIGNYSTNDLANPVRQNAFAIAMRNNPNVGRVMTTDGSRIYFETLERLVDEDVNDAVDVYEWHDGRVRLISPGNQSDDAYYHDNSADGRTVFFTTADRLIPALDQNASRDLYAARIGGGFPVPSLSPRCAGDGCQAASPPPPAVEDPASTAFRGPVDALDPAPLEARYRVLRFNRRQMRRFALRGRVVARIRVNAAGTVRVVASTRRGRRSTRVAANRVAVLRPGIARVPIRLSHRARAWLRDRGRLRVTLTFSYSEVDGVVARRVMLRG